MDLPPQQPRNPKFDPEKDLYDSLPPEILDHILLHFDPPTLFNCATLSKRWSQRVIPHLWHAPFMMYYVSWMKLLKTICTTGSGTSSRNSPKATSPNRMKSTTHSSSPSLESSPRFEHGSDNTIDSTTTTIARDPYGRLEGSFARLSASGGIMVRGFPEPQHHHQEDVENRPTNMDEEDNASLDVEEDDDEDFSGLLRLAENQEKECVKVGWGGNCTTDREVSTTSTGAGGGFVSFNPRDIFSASTSPSTNPSSDTRKAEFKDPKRGTPREQASRSVGGEGEGTVDIAINSTRSAEMSASRTDSNTNAKSSTTFSTATAITSRSSSPSSPAHSLRPSYGLLIRVLDFSHLYYIISDKFLTHLFPQTPLLQALFIHSPKQFSDTSLLALANSCPSLQRLELSSVGAHVSDTGLCSVLVSCPEIHTLVLSNSPGTGRSRSQITDKILTQLGASHAQTLRHLDLSNVSAFISCISISTSTSASSSPPSSSSTTTADTSTTVRTISNLSGLSFITFYCHQLLSLNVSHCSEAMTDTVLEHLTSSSSSSASRLQCLNIAYCHNITDAGLIALAGSCPDLRELDITGLGFVTDRGILEIGKRCLRFRKLVMDDEPLLTNKGIPMRSSSTSNSNGVSNGNVQGMIMIGGSNSSSSSTGGAMGRVSEDVLRCFPWGAEVVQRRMMLGWRYSRVF